MQVHVSTCFVESEVWEIGIWEFVFEIHLSAWMLRFWITAAKLASGILCCYPWAWHSTRLPSACRLHHACQYGDSVQVFEPQWPALCCMEFIEYMTVAVDRTLLMPSCMEGATTVSRTGRYMLLRVDACLFESLPEIWELGNLETVFDMHICMEVREYDTSA